MAEKSTAAKESLYDGKHFIINEKRVDKHTLIRTRIPLTPAVCDVCGLDLIVNTGLETTYDQMTSEEKRRVADAVVKHKELVHTPHSKLIVTEDEIPTSYLSSKKAKR